MTKPPSAVFLSYASQDASAARRLARALRAVGVETWLDEDELRGGDAWDERIRRQIRGCALFIPIISAAAAARHEGYFRLEWRLAEERSHMIAANRAFILPVCIDGTSAEDADVPRSFTRVQWSTLSSDQPPEGLVSQVQRLLAGGHSSRVDAASDSPLTQDRRRRRELIGWVAAVAVAVLLIGYGVNRAQWVTRLASSPAGAGDSPRSIIPEKSIAVLPFLDMSEHRDQEYFSDGLSEELIDLLTRSTDLQVPARTSSFFFKGRPTTIPDAAKALGVAFVLEGSVRKAGDVLRITAQLVRAADGYHVWSETYDRETKDIFKVQDEIAGAVVSALKSKLSPTRMPAVRRTSNLDAYNELLVGRQFMFRRDVDGYGKAIDAFHKAIALDPNYGVAYAGLAEAEFLRDLMLGEWTIASLDRALANENRAIELEPDIPEGYAGRSMNDLNHGDVQSSIADMNRALALDPNDSVSLRRSSLLQRCLGNLDLAIEQARRASQSDPLDAYAWLHLGEALASAGRFAEAETAMLRASQVTPESDFTKAGVLDVHLFERRGPEVVQSLQLLRDPELKLYYRALAAQAMGHAPDARKLTEEYVQRYGERSPGRVADLFAWLGDREQGIAWLNKAADRFPGDVDCVMTDPKFGPIRDDARFKEFLARFRILDAGMPSHK